MCVCVCCVCVCVCGGGGGGGGGDRLRYLTYCSHKPEYTVTTNHDRSVLITIISWHFQFHRVNVSVIHSKYGYGARSESRFACYSHCYFTWCPLMTGIVASQCPSRRCARDVLPHTFDIGVFKTVKNYSITIKHIYNSSANITECINVAFDTNNC